MPFSSAFFTSNIRQNDLESFDDEPSPVASLLPNLYPRELGWALGAPFIGPEIFDTFPFAAPPRGGVDHTSGDGIRSGNVLVTGETEIST